MLILHALKTTGPMVLRIAVTLSVIKAERMADIWLGIWRYVWRYV